MEDRTWEELINLPVEDLEAIKQETQERLYVREQTRIQLISDILWLQERIKQV